MVAVGLGVGAATAIVAYTVNAVLVGVFDAEPARRAAAPQRRPGRGRHDGAGDPHRRRRRADHRGGRVPRGAVPVPVARTGVHVAAVVSSAVFAVIHFEILFSQPLALGGLFVVGLALAYAFHATGNLVVPILGHAVFNAISVSLAMLVDRLGLDEMAEVAVIVRVALTSVGGG
jgi:hypothetical protein